jgi:ABC-type Fe3+/spermidine/putrescine transport system ATPase subunit
MAKLRLTDIHKSFGDTVVVKDLNLTLQEGEFVSLLGPSGCGKTTTLRMIAGFEDLTAGSIELNGRMISSAAGALPPEKRSMSMIFQSYAIWPNMTVAENVGFGLKVRKVPSAELKERVREMLDVVRLGHLAERYPAELSGGQQQRVALARAIVVRPEVLLLDEPLSNLDANLREEMAAEIRRLHDQFKTTTVYVTHDQTEAMSLSDRIAVMNGGQIEQVDTPWNLFNRPRTRFVASFIGQTNLLSGKVAGTAVEFDGFAVELADAVAGLATGTDVTVSIRPQGLLLQTADAATSGTRVIVQSKKYLGDRWEYGVVPKGSQGLLKACAAPAAEYRIGSELSLTVDRQLATILPPESATQIPAAEQQHVMKESVTNE